MFDKMFCVKAISAEYFEDLAQRSIKGLPFKKDIKSCCLLNPKSLHDLSGGNTSCQSLEKSESDENQSENDNWIRLEVPHKLLTYLIQCFTVSSVCENVIYVTNEKYFSLMQYFKINFPNFIFKVLPSLCKLKNLPIAKHIVVGVINSGIETEKFDLKNVVEAFFEYPRNIRVDEVFQVNLKETLLHSTQSLFKSFYIKILRINEGNEGEEEAELYVSDEQTVISFGQRKIQTFTPPVLAKYVPLENKIGYEIPLCPDGLDRYCSELEKLFKIFYYKCNGEFKPMMLLTGPRGSGKKTVLQSMAQKYGIKLLIKNCYDFIGSDSSDLKSKFEDIQLQLRSIFPSVLLLENIELMGRDDNKKPSLLAVEIFQNHIKQLFHNVRDCPVVVFASTHEKMPDLLPSIQKMFIKTVSFGALSRTETIKLLTWFVWEAGMISNIEVLKTVAAKINSYVFADIAKLMTIILKIQRKDPNLSEIERNVLRIDHWNEGIKIMEELFSASIGSAKVPTVHWNDVGGLDELKEEITLALEFPIKYPKLMTSGLKASGFLFYGPPGTGKTLMAKAVATEFSYNFLSVKGPELMNMYVGQSEKNVREVFSRARDAAPCIIFFDELDSLAPNRGGSNRSVTDRVVSQLLAEMDGLESNEGIFVIGATNRPDLVDPALLRPGRFDKMFYIGVCDTFESKLNVMKALTRRFSLAKDVKLNAIVKSLPSQVTGADMYSICSNAWLEAARKVVENLNKGGETELPVTVNMDDFERALSKFVPSLTPEIVAYYENYKNRFSRGSVSTEVNSKNVRSNFSNN